MSTSNGGSNPDTGGTATTAGRDTSGLLVTGKIRATMLAAFAALALVFTGLGLAVPSVSASAASAVPVAASGPASAATTAITAIPQHRRACTVNWRWRRVGGGGGNAQAWVDGMSPDGCAHVWVRATCRNRLGGSTFNGVPKISAAQGGTSIAQCSPSRSIATIWVVIQKGSGTPVEHHVYP